MIYDYENTIDFARQQGCEEGRQDKAVEVAEKLISLGLPPGQIAAATGLGEEQVENLKQNGKR